MWRGFAAAVLVVALFPAGAMAAASCGSGWTLLIPDGRIETVTTTSTADTRLGLFVTGGRSYCIEAVQSDWGNSLSFTFVNYTASCPSSDTADFVSRIMTEPKGDQSGISSVRRCGIATTGNDYLFARLANSHPTFTTVKVNAVETTLFNPRWSTYGGYVTSWGFQNTTDSPLNGAITVFDGTSFYTKTVSLPSQATVFLTTSAIFAEGTIGANKSGNAYFSHDGPPGGVLADAFLMSPSGVLVPGNFQPVRENRH